MFKELFKVFSPYEWILSNRLGGYSCGTAFSNLRKYNGLLIAGKDGGERFHLVSSIEEKVIFHSGLSYFLDTNFYRDVIYPEGYKLIREFFFIPYPSFYFALPQTEKFFLRKSIKINKHKNSVLISYENIGGEQFKLELRPKFSFRNHHSVQYEKDWKKSPFSFDSERISASLSKDGLTVFIYISGGEIKKEPIFYYNVYYPLEEVRGYQSVEDLFAPFRIEVNLKPSETFNIIFSQNPIEDINKEIDDINGYYKNFPELSLNKSAFSYDEYLKILEFMVDTFLLEDDIIAGFPWFYCWGRDTFIGIPALFYLEEGYKQAYKIFIKYKKQMKNGLIPNVVGNLSETNYNSVDATLWFSLRIFEFLEKFEDKITSEQKDELLSAVKEVIVNFLNNRFLPFRVDLEDGFIEIPEDVNLALTWMDVMIDRIPVTPRYGKPIEVCALWYNLLKFASAYLEESFLKEYGIKTLIRKQKKNFSKYFNGELWADRLFKNEPIFEIRPNYIIALSLPFDICDKNSMIKGLEVAKKELLTPYGLRSLSPRHPNFRKKYFGTQYMRDLAYHNGTVWVWLLYPYAEVLKKIYKNSKKRLLDELQNLVRPFRNKILNGKVGNIPEIYDGEAQNNPKGAIAQFWSASAIFLIEKEIQRLGGRF